MIVEKIFVGGLVNDGSFGDNLIFLYRLSYCFQFVQIESRWICYMENDDIIEGGMNILIIKEIKCWKMDQWKVWINCQFI